VNRVRLSPKKCGNLIGGQRLGETIALRFLALGEAEKLALRIRLNTLGNDAKLQRLRQRHDGKADGNRSLV
jgi:hypothetical protein